MPTRFYLPSSGAPVPPLSPAYDAAWEDISIAARLRTRTAKAATAMTTVPFTDADTSNKDILFRQYISDPIAAVSIVNPTIKFQIRGSETDLDNNLYTALHIRVVQADGILRGTILALTRDNLELALALTNRQFTASPTVTVNAQANDRIVIEVGYGGDPASEGSHGGGLRIGDADAADLPENNTATTDNNPWVELSTNIAFAIPSFDWFHQQPQIVQSRPRVTPGIVVSPEQAIAPFGWLTPLAQRPIAEAVRPPGFFAFVELVAPAPVAEVGQQSITLHTTVIRTPDRVVGY